MPTVEDGVEERQAQMSLLRDSPALMVLEEEAEEYKCILKRGKKPKARGKVATEAHCNESTEVRKPQKV